MWDIFSITNSSFEWPNTLKSNQDTSKSASKVQIWHFWVKIAIFDAENVRNGLKTVQICQAIVYLLSAYAN